MNYNRFFGFTESPFLDVPDPRFYFPAKQQETVLAELVQFVHDRQGLALVSGDEGVGKTMLIQTLLEKLPPSWQPLVITQPSPEPLAITVAIAEALDITLRERNLVKLTPFADAVQAAAQQGRYLVIILDDAHLLTDQHLEELYILAQMEHQGRQLMPIILVGRKGLVQKVASKANQRLRELCRLELALTGLTFEEVTRYLDHRLKLVGSSFQACFAEGCSGQIFARTGGIPRRLNQVCDQALERACQENRPRVTRDLLGGEEAAAPFKPLAPPARWGGKGWGWLLAGAAAAGLAGFILYTSYSGPALIRTAPPPAATSAPPPPPPSPEKAPPAAASVPPAPLPEQPAAKPAVQPEPPPPAAQASRPSDTKEFGLADTTTQPAAPQPAKEEETAGVATHQVARDDNLLRIVATYYPGRKEVGYDAIILANPRIANEDMIYSGQTLDVPKVDQKNIITLGKKHFAMLDRYYNSAQAAKAGARLRELQLHYLVRETSLPDDVKVYRLFIGGYDSKEELKKALGQAEQN